MVALVIFWAAVFAVLFFVLGVVFKALASVFNALMASTGVFAIGVLAAMAVIALYLLYAIADGIIKEGFWAVFGWVLLFLVVIGIGGAILGGLGAVLLELIIVVAEAVLLVVSGALEWLADKCERGYIKFLKVIINRLGRC